VNFSDLADPTKARIIVDVRESAVFDELFREYGAVVKRKQLEVGDFVCSERLVVERKTRDDFESSVIDGRLFRQLENLIHNFQRPVLIVEGASDSERIRREALLGAYTTVISDYGVPVFFTQDCESTAELVFSFAKHEQLSKRQPLRLFAKRKTLTPSQQQRSVVEMLPMVGPKIAKNLLNQFGNIQNIMAANEKELQQTPGVGKKMARLIRSLAVYHYKDEDDKF